MTESELNAAAQAIYESNRFKKPWDHPDTVRLWHPVCRREARAAIVAFIAAQAMTRINKRRAA